MFTVFTTNLASDFFFLFFWELKAYSKALKVAEVLEDEEDLRFSCTTNLEAVREAQKMWNEFQELLKEQKSYKRRLEMAERDRSVYFP